MLLYALVALNFTNVTCLSFLEAFVLKRQNKNLLSKIVSEREALTQRLSKIKLRFPRRLIKLAIILLFSFSLTGYYPAFSIPPVKRSLVRAVAPEQKGEIIAKSFSSPVVLPHPGYLSSRFSSWHPGIDIATGLGMPVHSITDGEVLVVGRDLFGLGNYVEVSHQNNFKSKYGHMGRIYVKVGQKVTSKNILGDVGLTGNTSGPHTHLEITHEGGYVNPQSLLPEIPDMPIPVAAKK